MAGSRESRDFGAPFTGLLAAGLEPNCPNDLILATLQGLKPGTARSPVNGAQDPASHIARTGLAHRAHRLRTSRAPASHIARTGLASFGVRRRIAPRRSTRTGMHPSGNSTSRSLPIPGILTHCTILADAARTCGMDEFDPYHKWLGIAKKFRPPTLYHLLGIDPDETDREVIEEAALSRSAHLRGYQVGPHAALCTRLLNEIAAARLTLLNPSKRAAYDTTLAPKTIPAAVSARASRTMAADPPPADEFAFEAGSPRKPRSPNPRRSKRGNRHPHASGTPRRRFELADLSHHGRDHRRLGAS